VQWVDSAGLRMRLGCSDNPSPVRRALRQALFPESEAAICNSGQNWHK
jgi:hypothetical protein